ncbi:MAG TPA: hypothetical protein VMR34_00990 [Candidatus Saccharimonadales bacterium]|nr:hypothetical protein [Candidatus Saccharimonadales bacterium]
MLLRTETGLKELTDFPDEPILTVLDHEDFEVLLGALDSPVNAWQATAYECEDSRIDYEHRLATSYYGVLYHKPSKPDEDELGEVRERPHMGILIQDLPFVMSGCARAIGLKANRGNKRIIETAMTMLPVVREAIDDLHYLEVENSDLKYKPYTAEEIGGWRDIDTELAKLKTRASV